MVQKSCRNLPSNRITPKRDTQEGLFEFPDEDAGQDRYIRMISPDGWRPRSEKTLFDILFIPALDQIIFFCFKYACYIFQIFFRLPRLHRIGFIDIGEHS